MLVSIFTSELLISLGRVRLYTVVPQRVSGLSFFEELVLIEVRSVEETV